MLEFIKLKEVGPAELLEFQLGSRLNILTGDNGLGKSFVLDIVWWVLTGDWAGEPARPRPSNAAPTIEFVGATNDAQSRSTVFGYTPKARPQDAWISEASPVWSQGLVIYARVDGSYSVYDSARSPLRHLGLSNTGNQVFQHLGTEPRCAFHFTPENVWDGLMAEDGRPYCNGLIKDWESWQSRKRPLFDQLSAVMHELSRGLQEELRPGDYVRLDVMDSRDLPTIRLPYGDVPITLLSSAMRRILALAYLLVWAWEEHQLAARQLKITPTDTVTLLIDEIESHLHPQWQRLILPAILEAVKVLNAHVSVQVFAVTHSPLVLTSLEGLFDETTDALFNFDLIGRSVHAAKLPWRPRGDVSTWLKSDVFDLKEARSKPAEDAIQKAMKALVDPRLPMDDVKRIHHELRSVLKDTDPFWQRWERRAQAAGIEP